MGKDPKNTERFRNLLAEARAKWPYGAQSKVAKIMRVSPAAVTRYKEGVDKVPELGLEELSRALSGEKYPEKTESIFMAGNVQEQIKGALQRAFDKFTAPIIAFAQGGEGAYPEDLGHAVPRIAVPCRDPNCYVLELEGDSMEPVYLEGDLLVVAPNMEAMNNDLVIVKTTEEEVLFKKLKKPMRGELFQFHSFNPHHPPLHLRPEQIDRVSVVHSVIRPLKERVRAMAVSESGHL